MLYTHHDPTKPGYRYLDCFHECGKHIGDVLRDEGACG